MSEKLSRKIIGYPGIIGEVKIEEKSKITKNYPEVVSRDNTTDWTVEWQIGPVMSSTYPGSVPLIKSYFKYGTVDYQEITGTVAGTSSYLTRWGQVDDYYRAAGSEVYQLCRLRNGERQIQPHAL